MSDSAAVTTILADRGRFAATAPPFWAAWSDLVRRRSLWVTFAMLLVMSVGFGVGMTYAIYRSAASDPAANHALVEGLREQFLL
ncbi:MAG: hypothetical protein LBU05_02480, partial [Bifidobacteriaceae bacterium]|nr:hypothetical protein [Bifidobacteriaceae bacterium]